MVTIITQKKTHSGIVKLQGCFSDTSGKSILESTPEENLPSWSEQWPHPWNYCGEVDRVSQRRSAPLAA